MAKCVLWYRFVGLWIHFTSSKVTTLYIHDQSSRNRNRFGRSRPLITWSGESSIAFPQLTFLGVLLHTLGSRGVTDGCLKCSATMKASSVKSLILSLLNLSSGVSLIVSFFITDKFNELNISYLPRLV